MNLFLLVIFSAIIVKVPYYTDNSTYKVTLYFSPGGKDTNWYVVAQRRYHYPVGDVKDSLRWLVREGKFKGNLKLVIKSFRGEKRIIKPKYVIEPFDESKFKPKVLRHPLKSFKSPDPYAWRMAGYDTGATYYYPFEVYPPLEFKWMFPPGYPDTVLDIQNAYMCVGNDMLYFCDPMGHYICQVMGISLETGEIIWKQVCLNANLTALAPNDTLLFVGTSIYSTTPSDDTTLWCLDARTGRKIWGAFMHTIINPIIIVDTFVYAGGNGGTHFDKYTISGIHLWRKEIGKEVDNGPTYGNEQIYVGFMGIPPKMLCLNSETGDSLWSFVAFDTGAGDNLPPFYKDTLYNCTYSSFYAVNAESGSLLWRKKLRRWVGIKSIKDSFLYVTTAWADVDTGRDIYCIKCKNIEIVWADTFNHTGYPPPGLNIPVTQNYLLYLGSSYIGIINGKNGEISLFEKFEYEGGFESDAMPMLYKTYLIGGMRPFLYVYKGDTASIEEVLQIHGELRVKPTIVINRIYIPGDNFQMIEIYDITGRLIKIFKRRERVYNINYLPAGIYFIKAKGVRGCAKIVKIK